MMYLPVPYIPAGLICTGLTIFGLYKLTACDREQPDPAPAPARRNAWMK